MKQKLKKIKMILFDVDGVLTDGSIIYSDKGTEIKAFNIQDGMGITLARKSGLLTGIITGRLSSMVSRRVEELKIDTVSQGSFDKLGPYLEILKKYKLNNDEICYIGDDIVDMAILNRVGFSAAVANAREEVKAICDYITVAQGGQGAVREVIDLILKRQGKFDVVINSIVNSDNNV